MSRSCKSERMVEKEVICRKNEKRWSLKIPLQFQRKWRKRTDYLHIVFLTRMYVHLRLISAI